jgi:hypothetical protein
LEVEGMTLKMTAVEEDMDDSLQPGAHAMGVL